MPRYAPLILWALLFAPLALAAEDQRPIENVLDHGAQADGEHDDAAAIQAAIDALPPEGGTVLLPPSPDPYVIRSGIRVHKSHVTIEGFLATIRWADRAMDGQIIDAIEIRGTPEKPLENITVRGLTIDANYWAQPGSYNPRGIDIDHARKVLIDRLHITRAFVGLTFGQGVSHSEARDCLITHWHNDAYNASADGETGSCHHIRFVRCRAANSRDERAGGLPGNRNNAWEIEDGTEHVTLVDCVVENCGGNGFAIRNHGAWDRPVHTRHTSLIRCRADDVSRHGFYARGINNDITVEDIHLEDCVSDSVILFHKDVRGLRWERCRFPASITLGPARDVVLRHCELGKITLWASEVQTDEGYYQTTLKLVDCLVNAAISVYGDDEHVTRRAETTRP